MLKENEVFSLKTIDPILKQIADYTHDFTITNKEAYQTARIALADALGCAILSLNYKACTKLLGPIISEIIVPNGSRVPGTSFILDPIQAAFNIGTMIRWLDFNDTWLAAEWGHPSDNIGGLLAVSDFLSQKKIKNGEKPLLIGDLLTAMIKAYEIQGGLGLLNSFNKIGFDHVIFVKVATTAVATQLLGGTYQQIVDAVSNAWIDTGPLRTYRHAPNTGSRKSWAAGDASSRGVFLSMLTMRGEMGYPQALTAKRWGLFDVLFQGKPFAFERPFSSYVMENILFKVNFPAEFHAQTAVECAIHLHPLIKNRIHEIDKITIETQESAIRIIDKTGPLNNPADRDHCLQYMVSIALLKGKLSAEDYEDEATQDPHIDILREKMEILDNPFFTQDYLDPNKRSIANAIKIHFVDGSSTPRIVQEYPMGHRLRRKEAAPLLFEKFEDNLSTVFSKDKTREFLSLFQDHQRLINMPINSLMSLFSH